MCRQAWVGGDRAGSGELQYPLTCLWWAGEAVTPWPSYLISDSTKIRISWSWNLCKPSSWCRATENKGQFHDFLAILSKQSRAVIRYGTPQYLTVSATRIYATSERAKTELLTVSHWREESSLAHEAAGFVGTSWELP